MAEVPLLVFKADIGSAVAVVGALISLVLVAWVLGWAFERRQGIQRWNAEKIIQEDSRRRFLRRLDHEMKNPLTGLKAALANLEMHIKNGHNHGIDGATDILAETRPSAVRQNENDSARRALADSNLQIERLTRLVGDLRKLAELEERPLETSQVDLAEVLEETVEAVCSLPYYSRRPVNLVIPRVPWPLPAVTGDRDLLQLAFYNLLENALKYSGAEAMVEIRAVEDGRRVMVEVADSGPGIPGEDLPRIFEELFRGSNARGLEGSGLGLALVRRIIDRHGGEINVRSRQGNQKGTVFRVSLPVK
jgi:two-component system, OmpR family, sensor kinase